MAESNVGANSSTFQMEMAKMIRDSDNIEAVTKAFDESGSESDDSSLVGSWDLLGLRAIKVKNENEVIANILTQQPLKDIKVAEFDSEVRAQIIYKYANNIINNKTRSVDDINEVKQWLDTMPPRPADRSKGFAEGASKKWFDFVYGNTQEQVLPRLLGKCQTLV